MSYRFYALLVIVTGMTAISYILIADDSRPASSCIPTDIGANIHVEGNQKIGEKLTTAFQFRNINGTKVVVTAIKPQVYGVEVTCETPLPKELNNKETLDFTLSVNTSASDSEKIAGAYVHWKELDATKDNVRLFDMTYHCADQWIVDQTAFNLGQLKIGTPINPVQIAVNKLKGDSWTIQNLKFDAKDDIRITAVDSNNARDASTNTTIARQNCGNLVVQLPIPQKPGSYVASITINDSQSPHTEAIQFTGTVIQ